MHPTFAVNMSHPTPVQSFLGGIGLAFPVHSLLVLNGSVFGISGFLHRAVRGSKEALLSVLGLVAGGVCVSLLERTAPPFLLLNTNSILFSGLCVGLGTKLANGCTSGHMICGISRVSARSIVATATFFVAGVITTHLRHADDLSASLPSWDWTFGKHGPALLVLQSIPLLASLLLSRLSTEFTEGQAPPKPNTTLRGINCFLASLQFAVALRLSNLTEPTRVLSFLLLPLHKAFDPSLAFLAAGALPASVIFYNFWRGKEVPRLGGSWSIPKGGPIDARLILGSAIFGVGWGIAGVCPGPSLVNLGRVLSTGTGIQPVAEWLTAFVIGGLLA